MASFKRVKLFTNISEFDSNNVIYDEVWGFKILSEDDVAKIGRYRIRYQKADSAFMFAEEGITESEAEAMAAWGPAISCVLEKWTEKGWIRCLDWMGDASIPVEIACSELNDQYRSFLTGAPIEETFYSSPGVPPVRPDPNKPRKNKATKDPEPPEASSGDDSIDWV